MDFQWFEHVTWDSIKDLRGTTYVQPPKIALQQVQHATPTCHHSQQPFLTGIRASLESACFSAAGSFWDDLQSMRLRATVHTFWMHDWNSFGLLSGPWYVLNVMLLRCRTRRAEQPRSKVATLASTGEKGRALAAAGNAPPVSVTEQIVQEIKSLYPADPEPPAPASAPISALFLSEVAEFVPSTLRKMPRLSEPGPLGMRAEHWYDFGSLAGNSDLFVQVIADIAAAAVPKFSVTIFESWTDHTTCQTCRGPQTTPHDVISPQTRSQISHGSKERISGQVRGTFAVWCWKTRWCKYDDQDHPVPGGSR